MNLRHPPCKGGALPAELPAPLARVKFILAFAVPVNNPPTEGADHATAVRGSDSAFTLPILVDMILDIPGSSMVTP